MSREFPDWVNPWKAAEGHRSFGGTIPLKRLERLLPLLASSEGVASFELRFARDALGVTTVELEVSADLPLQCQASLETYLQPVRRKNVLAVTGDEFEPDDIPADYELTHAQEGRLVLADLVQDELILAVPQVPRKPGLGPVRYTTDPDASEEDEHNRPFAGLGDLLKGERGNSNQH